MQFTTIFYSGCPSGTLQGARLHNTPCTSFKSAQDTLRTGLVELHFDSLDWEISWKDRKRCWSFCATVYAAMEAVISCSKIEDAWVHLYDMSLHISCDTIWNSKSAHVLTWHANHFVIKNGLYCIEVVFFWSEAMLEFNSNVSLYNKVNKNTRM